MPGALEGIKVLELARTLAGPYCSMLLADMGADVLKVEQPGTGDETRGYKPPDLGGEATYFISLNRNKRGITLNLKTKEGQDIVKKLAAEADVLIENFRTGTMEKFGIGYDVLKEINPRLIYCAVSGFGRTGPMKNEPAYDLLMQAFGGLMSVTGEPDRSPVKVGFSVVDLATGTNACAAITAALYHREKTGVGQYVESSLLESIVAWQGYLAIAHFATGNVPQRYGSAHPNIAPYQVFQGSDADFIIAIPNDWLWRKMCDALGLDDLKDHPKFAVNIDRVANRVELIDLLNQYTKSHTAEETISKLKAAGVPCGPINTIDKVLKEPQVLHREMVVEVDHPTAGKIKLLGVPMTFSETPASVRKAPPLLGENNQEVLGDLGYSEEDISELKEKGVI
ncbi:MAG: CaiB/BaiF CoA-transferase family protein [Desulfotomaculaceae bacterium]